MKILLLSDIPPCSNFTAGLVLEKLCSFLPPESISCFIVKEVTGKNPFNINVHRLKIKSIEKPLESFGKKTQNFFRQVGNTLLDLFNFHFFVPKILKEIQVFCLDGLPDVIWCVLQGPTMIRLGKECSGWVPVPLLTQVWDPPSWILREKNFSSFSKKMVLSDFEAVLKKSQACGVASWQMAEFYHKKFGVFCLPLIPSLDFKVVRPFQASENVASVLIGFAGQLYSGQELESFFCALDEIDWMICGREVRFRIFGGNINLASKKMRKIEYFGWASQEELIKQLSQMDLLYCPYWFAKEYECEARLSFPSKLTTYLAAGRPVFCHSPSYASPFLFLQKFDAGYLCSNNDSGFIINMLRSIVQNPERSREIALNGLKAFQTSLVDEKLRDNFFQILQKSLNRNLEL